MLPTLFSSPVFFFFLDEHKNPAKEPIEGAWGATFDPSAAPGVSVIERWLHACWNLPTDESCLNLIRNCLSINFSTQWRPVLCGAVIFNESWRLVFVFFIYYYFSFCLWNAISCYFPDNTLTFSTCLTETKHHATLLQVGVRNVLSSLSHKIKWKWSGMVHTVASSAY